MKTKYWIGIFGGILVLCGLFSLFFFSSQEAATRAHILSEGKVLHTVDLFIDREIVIETKDGGRNVVTVKDGKIAVTEANCPDHYCMGRGYCNGGTQIVCLPNRLVIEFLGQQEIDGMVG